MQKKKLIYILVVIVCVLALGFGYMFLFNKLVKHDINISNFDFSIVADSFDSSGLDLDSGFIITANEDYNLADVKSAIKVSPEFEYSIDKSGYGRYYLKPESELKDDSIYNIYVNSEDNELLNSWAFQTKAPFKVVSSLPANESICTNLDSGIEINFSKKVEKIDNYFEIIPNIEGKFNYVGKTVTFVPSIPLVDGENYTVKIKAGLQAIDGDKLENDFVFSFDAQQHQLFSEKIFLRTNKENFTSNDNQVISLVYGKNDYRGEIFDVKVYNLGSHQKYLELLKQEDEIDSSNLEVIREFNSELTYEDSNYTHNAFILYPEKLSFGWYLVDIKPQNSKQILQQLVQVSDISVYMQSFNGDSLIWCNDITTGESLSNISVKIQDKNYKTNANGVVLFEADKKSEVIVETSDGRYFVEYIDFSIDWEEIKYNIYLYTDRESYYPTDTINYWGMIVPQNSNYKLPKTVKLYINDKLMADEINVNSSGIFTGKLDINNHISTYGELLLEVEGKKYYATGISIEEYVKPNYILDFEFDKEYYRKNDVANINVEGIYFDGNPASKLELNLNIENDTESIQLNEMGQETIQYAVNHIVRKSWEPTYVYANLQTSGADEDASKGKSFIYCPTDFALQTEVIDNELIIKTNSIDFSKIKVDGFNTQDLIADPCGEVFGKVNVYRTDYIKKQVGTYYDFINKTNKPKYEYSTKKVLIETLEFETDEFGISRIPVEYESLEDSYYSFEISYVMPDGFEGKTSDSLREIPPQNDDIYYYFDTGYKNFNVNENVNVKIKSSQEFINNGKVLYTVINEELQDVAVTLKEEFDLKYKQEYIPDVLLLGAYFDGNNLYRINPSYLYYNLDEKALNITITTDKEIYKPGETVKVNVEARDINGKAAKTNVVISVVDEAAFAVNEQYEYPLNDLYSFEYYNPKTYFSSNILDEGFGWGEGGGGGDYGSYREYFKDTAAFLTIKTSSNGKTTASFTLPDNITSWRITAVGITDTLKAGVGTNNIITTLPFYTNVVMNKKYNIEDDIAFTLKSSGTDLPLMSSSIKYEVTIIKDGEIINSDKKYQLPFRTVNINLGKVLEPGDYRIEIKSECGVYKDTIVKEISVENSLHEINISKNIELAGKLDIEAVKYPVTLMIYDVKNKQYYDVIEKILRTSVGITNDQKLAYNIAIKKLNELNENNYIDGKDINNLQNYDGGIKLLDYSESDVLLTAKTCAVFADKIDTFASERYFENILNSKDSSISEISAAYFGLATLKKPVLNDITYLLENSSDFSLQDKLNLIAGLAYIGDNENAKEWYEKLIQPRLKVVEDTSYIYSYDEYESYSTTSFLTMILSKVKHQDLDKVLKYIVVNDFAQYTPCLDLVEYIKTYNPKTDSKGSLKYSLDGKEEIINFSDINNFMIKFNEKELKKFEILENTDLLGKIFYFGTIDEITNLYDNNINIQKTISGGKNIGDISTVTLKIKIPSELKNEKQFIINDIVPNGMRFVGSDVNYLKDSQKLKFVIYNNDGKFEYIINYNVRNVLQGEYKIEPAIVSTTNFDNWGYSDENKITIE